MHIVSYGCAIGNHVPLLIFNDKVLLNVLSADPPNADTDEGEYCQYSSYSKYYHSDLEGFHCAVPSLRQAESHTHISYQVIVRLEAISACTTCTLRIKEAFILPAEVTETCFECLQLCHVFDLLKIVDVVLLSYTCLRESHYC